MKCIVFPKFFQELTARELGAELSDIGFDGVDVMVRDGFWVEAANIERTLPEFVSVMRDFGLSAESASTDYLEPRDPDTERSLACLAKNGVHQFRLRHFRYDGPQTFHESFDAARRALELFEKLGEKHEIRAFVQTHGGSLHPSASASYALVRGFDPKRVGVHHDPGNMICQEGYEAWDKGFDILGDYLCMVGVKNAGLFRTPHGDRFRLRWRRQWTTLEEGVVDYREVLKALRERAYSGPLCMHNFYDRGLDGLKRQTRADLRYLRALLEDAST